MEPTKNNSNQTGNNLTPGSSFGKPPSLLNMFIIVFLINFALNLFFGAPQAGSQIEYSQFIKLVESGLVSKVQIEEEQLLATLKPEADLGQVEAIIYPSGTNPNNRQQLSVSAVLTTARIDDPALVDRLAQQEVGFYRPMTRTSSPVTNFIMSWIVPVLAMYLVFGFLSKSLSGKMGSMGMGQMGALGAAGKSKAKEYTHEKSTGVTFEDVAGQEEAKESLAELVDFLKNPGKYHEIGAKQPKGALLVGPPGTGKTLLARALAGEAGVPFYSITGSEFVEMFVGVGASRVRDLFENAKKNAPSIIFIDEIDAIGKSRDNQLGGNDEREQTLNQLLSEMDGFDVQNGIIVLAATNRPEVLDKALLRPGRFDRRIAVEKPDLLGREAILNVHASKVKMGADVNLRELALATSGATGADLANMVNEGALMAVKDGRKTVCQSDLMEAVEVVIAGKEKKDRIMNQAERKIVAYHEVGHALTSALQNNSQPVQKITIVPRTMGSLGYTLNMPQEERYLHTKSDLLAQITTLLGGRAAEQVKFGEVTTGSANDIERATALARAITTQYGMSGKFGPMSLESVENRYLDGRAVRNFSTETEGMIDEEIRLILDGCLYAAIELLEENKGHMDNIAMHLLEKENITGEEFMALLNGKAIEAA
ncbi:MAG: ATP-dependent zinc metalloprotease FtsH [Eubacteriaceae bacterium]|nr:ATP-dependent zinc metalloprotease FtsH [Eubacteriaceae bacterium]